MNTEGNNFMFDFPYYDGNDIQAINALLYFATGKKEINTEYYPDLLFGEGKSLENGKIHKITLLNPLYGKLDVNKWGVCCDSVALESFTEKIENSRHYILFTWYHFILFLRANG